MKRASVVEKSEVYDPPLIRWINRGGNLVLADGRKIPRKGTFTATEDEIPKSFRNSVQPVDPVAAATVPAESVFVPGFHVVQREGTDFYDLVDRNGRRLNEKDLSKQKAEELLEQLVK